VTKTETGFKHRKYEKTKENKVEEKKFLDGPLAMITRGQVESGKRSGDQR